MNLLNLFKKNWILLILFFVLVFGFIVRTYRISNNNVVFGYDEVEDLIHARKIAVDGDLVVIGKAIYGIPGIRHGVFSYYLLAPALLLFNQNPWAAAVWVGLFNLLTAVVVYFTAKSLFKNKQLPLVAATLYTFSYLVVEYSGWVAHPTFAILFVSLFFFGLLKAYKGKSWGYLVGSLFLGLSIQADLIFLYLVPIAVLFLVFFKPLLPKIRTIIYSFSILLLTLSTFIYTELLFNFSTLKAILKFSETFDEGRTSLINRLVLFSTNFFEVFSKSVLGKENNIGVLLAVFVVSLILFFLIKARRRDKPEILFLLFYLFSPAITLVLGYHDKPWSFLGILPAISIAVAFVISKLKYRILILPLVAILVFVNIDGLLRMGKKSGIFLTLPKTSILESQIKVIDYTYAASNGKSFSIDAVTYPLYVNTYWSYHYPWYGRKKYKYVPTWSGSDQVYPHNTLPKPDGREKYVYLIIDNTPDIPDWAKLEAKMNMDSKSILLEEREISGFIVQKREPK